MGRPKYVFVGDDVLKASRLRGKPFNRPLIFTASTNQKVLEYIKDEDVAGIILDIEADEFYGEALNYFDLVWDLEGNFAGYVCAVSDRPERREEFEGYFKLPSYSWEELTTKVIDGSLQENV